MQKRAHNAAFLRNQAGRFRSKKATRQGCSTEVSAFTFPKQRLAQLTLYLRFALS